MRSLRFLSIGVACNKPAKRENPFIKYKDCQPQAVIRRDGPVKDKGIERILIKYDAVANSKLRNWENFLMASICTVINPWLGAAAGVFAIVDAVFKNHRIKRIRSEIKASEEGFATRIKVEPSLGGRLYQINEKLGEMDSKPNFLNTFVEGTGTVAIIGTLACISQIAVAIKTASSTVENTIITISVLIASAGAMIIGLKIKYSKGERENSMQRISDLADK